MDPELTRMTLEIVALAIITSTVAALIGKRRSVRAGVVAGTVTAMLCWVLILFVELGLFGRWT